MGSSIGIALITTFLAHQQAVHRAVLTEKLTAFAPEADARIATLSSVFARQGSDPFTAHQRAFAALDGIINGQAMLLSFADVFRYVALAFIVTLPLLLLLGRGGNKDAVAAAH
jgi:DHA2 family multidrug resistance protein